MHFHLLPKDIMRTILFIALGITLLLLAGCSEGDKITNNITGDTTHWPGGHIRNLSPAANDVSDIQCQWREISNPYPHQCRWYYYSDTILTARVYADVPGGVHDARVFTRSSAYSDYHTNGLAVAITGDTFDVPIVHWTSSNTPGNDQLLSWQFFVLVTAADSSQWTGPVSTLSARLVAEALPSVPPNAPDADTLYEQYYSDGFRQLFINWCYSSPRVDTAYVHARSDFDGIVHVVPVYASSQAGYTLRDHLPTTRYAIWIDARNHYGLSAPSDTLWVNTREPFPPQNLTASLHFPAPVTLTLSWRNQDFCDSLRISRRVAAGEWTTIATLDGISYSSGYSANSYTDSTVAAGTAYDYRVGVSYPNGTWWSADSVHVAVP
jgi:hypothetical protein